jgi:speckle-type POZ protein
MFSSSFLESQTNVVNLQFKKPEIFKILLLWMYCGEIRFPDNIFDVFELLLLADEYGLIDLKEKCEEDMKLKLHETNVLQMLILCETHPIVSEGLAEKCKSLFIQEFDQIQKINPNLEKEIISVPGLMIKLFAHIHSKKNKKRKVTFVIEEHISEND